METMNSPESHSDDLESRKLLGLRLERAEAEVEHCRTQLMAISRRHPSLRWLDD
jgi:hypothetical protein